MNILEKLDGFINEGKIRIEKVKHYSSPKEYNILYFSTDGKNYSLDKGDGLFLTDEKNLDVLKVVDGPLKSKDKDLEVMEYKGKFGLWDSNLKLVMAYKNMDDLEQHYKDQMADYGEYEYAKRLKNFDLDF